MENIINENETYVIMKIVFQQDYSIKRYYCGVCKGLKQEYTFNVDTNRWEWKINERTTYIGFPVKNVDGNPMTNTLFYINM